MGVRAQARLRARSRLDDTLAWAKSMSLRLTATVPWPAALSERSIVSTALSRRRGAEESALAAATRGGWGAGGVAWGADLWGGAFWGAAFWGGGGGGERAPDVRAPEGRVPEVRA